MRTEWVDFSYLLSLNSDSGESMNAAVDTFNDAEHVSPLCSMLFVPLTAIQETWLTRYSNAQLFVDASLYSLLPPSIQLSAASAAH